MRVVPKRPDKQLSFFQSHLTRWSETYASIGLSEDDIADLQTRLDAAKQARAAQVKAYRTARNATRRFHRLSSELASAGSKAILKIRGKASSDQNVYSQAWLPKPKKAAPIAEPGVPGSFSFVLLQNGQLQLRWKCKNPPNAEGTMYEVWRSVDHSPQQFLGISGEKKFTDSTIPPGSKFLIYQVTAVRGKKRGEPGNHIMHFGGAPVSIPPSTTVRRAA